MHFQMRLGCILDAWQRRSFSTLLLSLAADSKFQTPTAPSDPGSASSMPKTLSLLDAATCMRLRIVPAELVRSEQELAGADWVASPAVVCHHPAASLALGCSSCRNTYRRKSSGVARTKTSTGSGKLALSLTSSVMTKLNCTCAHVSNIVPAWHALKMCIDFGIG